MNKCVFLDRDGVLNHDKVDYVYTIDEFRIFDGVADALADLKAAGFLLIIITNQSGIAKGVYTEKAVWDCYEYLQQQTGTYIDAMYFCPHHPDFDQTCTCRKPGTKMILDAMQAFTIDPQRSFMVGDAKRDIVAGNSAGLRTIHIDNGKEKVQNATHVATSLWEASRWILSNAS